MDLHAHLRMNAFEGIQTQTTYVDLL